VTFVPAQCELEVPSLQLLHPRPLNSRPFGSARFCVHRSLGCALASGSEIHERSKSPASLQRHNAAVRQSFRVTRPGATDATRRRPLRLLELLVYLVRAVFAMPLESPPSAWSMMFPPYLTGRSSRVTSRPVWPYTDSGCRAIERSGLRKTGFVRRRLPAGLEHLSGRRHDAPVQPVDGTISPGVAAVCFALL
jgi:hypothetical protein